MVSQTPINCPDCGKQVTTEENIRHLVMTNDLKCLYCGAVVVYIPKVTY